MREISATVHTLCYAVEVLIMSYYATVNTLTVKLVSIENFQEIFWIKSKLAAKDTKV